MQANMRIAFVDHKLNLRDGGGSNITLHHMACGLTERGHDVTVVTVGFEHSPVPENAPYRIIERPLATRVLNLRAKFALASVLREMEAQVDIFQIEAPSLISAGGLYRFLGGQKPVVARLHNYGFFCTNIRRMDSTCYQRCTLMDRIRHRRESTFRKVALSPLRTAEHFANLLLVHRLNRFIALSPAVAQIHSRYGMDSRKMVIIPPPRDPAMIGSSALSTRDRSADPDAPFRILFTGRLSKVKGVDTLLDAVAGLDFPWTIDIVGEGLVRAELEQQARELGVADRVTFHGWVSQQEIVGFYRKADVFVHPARWPEPAGRTVIEAVALGVPSIVSDIGGPPWIAGDAALTFRPGDQFDLRAKISQVAKDPDLSTAMRAAARQHIQRFDRAHIVEMLMTMYRELCPTSSDAETIDLGGAASLASGEDANVAPVVATYQSD